MDRITKEQYEKLSDSSMNQKEFNKLLEEYTGIFAKPVTRYQYFDSMGNYVGNSIYNNLDSLLNNAYDIHRRVM